MGTTRISFILALGASLWAGVPEPGAEAPKAPAEASATVTVTAEASPVEIAKTPNPVRVLDKAALEATGARTLSDLLEDLFPGQLTTTGGVGTTSSLLLNGSRSQDVVVTLDGIRLTDAAGTGGVNLSTLGLAGIDRVEVQLGPCSSRFGPDAMGGAIALSSSASAPAGLSGDVRVGLGNQGIRLASTSEAYGWNGGYLRTALQGYQEDQATPTNQPFQTTGIYLGVGQSLGQDTMATVSYRNTFAGVPIPYVDTTDPTRVYNAAREERTRNQEIIGTLRSQLNDKWTAELSIGQALQTRMEPNDYAGVNQPYDSRRDQVVGHLGWAVMPGVGLNLGVDAFQEFCGVPDYAGGTDRADGHHLGADLEGNWEPLQWLRLVGSAREQWDRQAYEFQAGSVSTPNESNRSTTYKLGANALLGGGFRIYASGGTGFSLPLLYNVLYNQQNGGPSLQDEKSSFMRFGSGWERGPWNARLEASRTHFSQLVFWDPSLGWGAFNNGSDIQTQGIEGAVGYKTATWGVEGSWRNQEARELDVPAAQQLSTAAVARRPFNILSAKSWVKFGNWRLEGSWSWTGSHYETYGGYPVTVVNPDRTHFNDLSLGAAWAATKDLSFSLKGQHLLQPRITVQDWLTRAYDGRNDAAQIAGFPAQPPTLTLDMRYRF